MYGAVCGAGSKALLMEEPSGTPIFDEDASCMAVHVFRKRANALFHTPLAPGRLSLLQINILTRCHVNMHMYVYTNTYIRQIYIYIYVKDVHRVEPEHVCGCIVYVCMYVCMHACMYVLCMHVCLCECMYVRTHVFN